MCLWTTLYTAMHLPVRPTLAQIKAHSYQVVSVLERDDQAAQPRLNPYELRENETSHYSSLPVSFIGQLELVLSQRH